MNLAGIRDTIVSFVAANWGHPTIPLFYENTEEVDLQNMGDYFLKVEINFTGASQANIGDSPFQREYGELVVTVFARQTLGVRAVLVYLGELSSSIRFRNLGGVHMQEAAAGNETSRDGWFSMDMTVPFYADSNA